MGDEVEITTMSQTHRLSVKAGSHTCPEPGPLPSRTWRSPWSSKDSVPKGNKGGRGVSIPTLSLEAKTSNWVTEQPLPPQETRTGILYFADAALSPGLRKELLGA